MKNNKKAVFICQLSEDSLKITKLNSSSIKGNTEELVEIFESPKPDDKIITEKLKIQLKKLAYNSNPIIIALPRLLLTCRYLQVPAQAPAEIEKIIKLQAPRYLPYPADELITGYQIISTNKAGYSEINIIIAHKETIERQIRIFSEIKPASFKIIPSSYGLARIYNSLKPSLAGIKTFIIEANLEIIELAICRGQKTLFSRTFKLNKHLSNWKDLFIDEIKKSADAHVKETSTSAPERAVLFSGNKELNKEIIEILKAAGLETEEFSNYSCAGLAGLKLASTEETLNLLPENLKEKIKNTSKYKNYLRNIIFFISISLIWLLGIAKNLENKTNRLVKIKKELSDLTKTAKPLEEMEKKLKIIENNKGKKDSLLDFLYETHKILPQEISLLNFKYEEPGKISLTGQAPELNLVFSLAQELKKSSVFKNMETKIRYATKRRTQNNEEIIDFEITCAK